MFTDFTLLVSGAFINDFEIALLPALVDVFSGTGFWATECPSQRYRAGEIYKTLEAGQCCNCIFRASSRKQSIQTSPAYSSDQAVDATSGSGISAQLADA